MQKKFDEIFEDVTKLGTKIKTDEYHKSGRHQIIDQGQESVAGYTDLEDGLFEDVPAIIFGDHTRIIKYVDQPFFLGADGVKVLRSCVEDANYRYLYYALKNVKIPNTGYNRHFKWLKTAQIKWPNAETQSEIVTALDGVSRIVEYRQQQLQKLDELVKARFVEMFGDPVSNPLGWEIVPLGKRCKIVTGNTPSRAEPENYGEFIEWIKSDNINTPFTFVTKAQEYLSETGFKKCRFVEAGSLLMTCIAGSINCIGNVAVTDRRVAFNQQINAIVPEQDEVLYLYWLMLLSKPAIHSTINMALKGILSKGQLAELVFPFPPIKLQEQFVTFVEQVDKSKVAVQKALDEAQLLFDSLMQKYFG